MTLIRCSDFERLSPTKHGIKTAAFAEPASELSPVRASLQLTCMHTSTTLSFSNRALQSAVPIAFILSL